MGETEILRAALERYADGATGAHIAIKALTEIDGHSRWAEQVRELWKAQGAYGHTRQVSRKTQRKAELDIPVDPEYEARARLESAWAQRECFRTMWEILGAPVTVIRVTGAAEQAIEDARAEGYRAGYLAGSGEAVA